MRLPQYFWVSCDPGVTQVYLSRFAYPPKPLEKLASPKGRPNDGDQPSTCLKNRSTEGRPALTWEIVA
jgi:hypothetical protein